MRCKRGEVPARTSLQLFGVMSARNFKGLSHAILMLHNPIIDRGSHSGGPRKSHDRMRCVNHRAHSQLDR